MSRPLPSTEAVVALCGDDMDINDGALDHQVDCNCQWSVASVRTLAYLMVFRTGLSLVSMTAYRPSASKSGNWHISCILCKLHQNNSCHL